MAVTDDHAVPSAPGCDAVTLINAAEVSVVGHGPYRASPGQIAASSDASLIVTQYNNGPPFVHVMLWRPGARGWGAAFFDDARLARGGAIGISPGNETLLVAHRNAVAKYRVDAVTLTGLGPEVATADFGTAAVARAGLTVAAAFEFTADGRTAYVVASDGYVHSLDVDSMKWLDDPLPYVATAQRPSYRVSRTHATLSPDERWLVINTADQLAGKLNIVDVRRRESKLADAEGLRETWGVAFNHVGPSRSHLVVHGRAAIAVYQLLDGQLLKTASSQITPQDVRRRVPAWQVEYVRHGPVAWSGDGTRIIASIGGAREWRILGYDVGSDPSLYRIADIESCTASHNLHAGLDVVTIQEREPPPTPTSTATTVPLPTTTSSPTPSAAVTGTVTPEPSASASATPKRTDVPRPCFLPLLLNEHCDREYRRADVALLLDTSSSMSGTKLAEAKAAGLLFVGLIDLEPGRSQIAVVRYDREAKTVQQLTRSRSSIEAAIRSLRVRSGTHIEKGLRAALSELQSPRRLDRNLPVMILLTDGLQTGTPGEELRAAVEVRDAGVRIYTIGLGSDVEEEALRTMASEEDRYYFAPDSADLARIYTEIAQDLMCPGKEFWGRR